MVDMKTLMLEAVLGIVILVVVSSFIGTAETETHTVNTQEQWENGTFVNVSASGGVLSLDNGDNTGYYLSDVFSFGLQDPVGESGQVTVPHWDQGNDANLTIQSWNGSAVVSESVYRLDGSSSQSLNVTGLNVTTDRVRYRVDLAR